MKYHNRKNKILVNHNRKISRSSITGVNLKRRRLYYYDKVPLEPLPTKRKLNISTNNTNNNNNTNDNKNSNILIMAVCSILHPKK